MQRAHTVIAWLLLLLLILHLVMGSVTLLTPVFLNQRLFAYVFFAVVCVHGLLALWKTVRGKRVRQLTAYGRKNRRYWLRLVSGIAIFVLVLVHRTLWTLQTPFGVLLREFEWPSLLAQLLLVTALGVHVLANVQPLLIDSGIDPARRAGRWMRVLAVLFVLLAVMGACMYFVRGAL